MQVWDNGKLDQDTLHRLRNPIPQPLAIENQDLLFSIKLFLSTSGASQEVYNDTREAVLQRHPEDEVLSYYQITLGAHTLADEVHLPAKQMVHPHHRCLMWKAWTGRYQGDGLNNFTSCIP